jgi:endonuclease YncB( thermonuclease family)
MAVSWGARWRASLDAARRHSLSDSKKLTRRRNRVVSPWQKARTIKWRRLKWIDAKARTELIEREERIFRSGRLHRRRALWPISSALICVAAVALALDWFPKDRMGQRLEAPDPPLIQLPTVIRFPQATQPAQMMGQRIEKPDAPRTQLPTVIRFPRQSPQPKEIGQRLETQPIEPKQMLAGIASVIDGDTIEIHGRRIRLWGIDAPEESQLCRLNGKTWRCGQQSALALSSYIGLRTVSCEQRDIDRYGRAVAVCSIGQTRDLSEWLIRSGWALDYSRYSRGAYSDAQREAERTRRGMWQGQFDKPWEWRGR